MNQINVTYIKLVNKAVLITLFNNILLTALIDVFVLLEMEYLMRKI